MLQLDVCSAFLNAEVEEVFVKRSPGFEVLEKETETPLVMQLKKSLYGLKQSPRNCNSMLTKDFSRLVSKPV